MYYPLRPMLLVVIAIGVVIVSGCSTRSMHTLPHMDSTIIEISRSSGLSKIETIDNGILIPDGKGNVVWSPDSTSSQKPHETFIQAQELRLKVKELAAQLLDTQDNTVLIGFVALPTSFVNLNNFSETSPLGRYMSEAMIYEFNQRGFPIKEYRMDKKIYINNVTGGEFVLKRDLPPLAIQQQWTAVLIGTYLKENNAIFVNARLIRVADGLVLRTAQIVLPENTITSSMTKKPVVPPAPPIASGVLQIKTNNNKKTIPVINKPSIQPQTKIKRYVPITNNVSQQDGNNTKEYSNNNNNNIERSSPDISKVMEIPPKPGIQ